MLLGIIAFTTYIYINVPLRTAIFRSFAKGTVYLTSDQDTLYVFGYGGVQKYLVSDPSNPILLAENDNFCKNCFVGHLIARSGVVNGDYLYVACRSYLGGSESYSDENYIDGKILVLRKTNLSIVNEYKSDIKLIETKIKDSLLVVSGLYGFDIYNIKNAPDLKELYKYRQQDFTEFQGVDFIEKDSVLLLAFGRFGNGVSLWDISNLKNVRSIYDFSFSDTLSNGQTIKGRLQCFNLLYRKPYLYATVAPIKEAFEKDDDIRGILIFNLLNLNRIQVSFTEIPRQLYYKTLIGDPEPTYISEYGNRLYTNFGEKGVASFDVTDLNNPKFEKVINVCNDGNMILPLNISRKGILFTGDYYWNDIYSYQLNKD